MSSDFTPFKGRIAAAHKPARLLRRFTKSGHVAEIREREVHDLEAIEFIVFVDGSLLESRMFHGRRLGEYPCALEQRAKQFADESWVESFDRP